MDHRTKIIGAALFCIAFGSEALTLGRVRGAALIGRPLDIVVQVQMDAGEDASSLCFDADVFHADTRQDGSRVRVAVEATAQPQMVNVRVLSSAAVDEPVVTVYLRTGCGQKTTRRYVLLADFPSEVAAPLVPAARPVAPVAVRPPVLMDVISATPVLLDPAKTVRVPKPTVRRRVDNQRPEAKTAAAVMKAPVDDNGKLGRSAGRSRLKLDPLELFSSRVATLESFKVTPPVETSRDMQKMQALEGDVKALLAVVAKNEASLVDLKIRLQKAESERFPRGLIYGLIALVLASLTAVAVLWSRQRRVQAGDDEWWRASIATPAAEPAPPEPVAEPATASKAQDEAIASNKARKKALATALDDAHLSSAVDVSMVEMSDSSFDDLMQAGAAHGAIRKPSSPSSPASTFGPSISGPAGLSLDETHRPLPLDLDLSDMALEGLASKPVLAADVDLLQWMPAPKVTND